MAKLKISIYITLLLLVCCTPKTKVTNTFTGKFEGTEPFWSLGITDNQYVLICNNKTEKGFLIISSKSERGETFAFFDKNLYGIINRNWGNNCELAITEKDSLPYEIFFSFEHHTYKGCGEVK